MPGAICSATIRAPAAFFEDKTDAYHELGALLVRQGKPLETLAMAKCVRARVLLEICRSPKLDLSREMNPRERAEERRLYWTPFVPVGAGEAVAGDEKF